MYNYHIHLSNRTEQLYEALKQRLFADSHPFTRRMIMVPSSAMKSWLQLRMAEDPAIGVATGVEIEFVDTSLHKLYHTLASSASQEMFYSPSELELSLALEETIKTVIATYHLFSGAVQKQWYPLLEYLRASLDKKTTKAMTRRIRALSSQLAVVFRDYGIYGKERLSQWRGLQASQELLERESMVSGWQKLLWEHMEQLFDCWDYPVKKFSSFQCNEMKKPDLQVHLFGLSFLAPVYHAFLKEVSKKVPVYSYFLSPCQKFWGDILSDKERIRLTRYWSQQGAKTSQVESLEEFLRDRNPILANFGRMGREMTTAMESLEAVWHEQYALPESIVDQLVYQDWISDDLQLEKSNAPLTLLQSLQADITLLRSPGEESRSLPALSFPNDDITIQVHAAPKIRREVEAIHDALLKIMEKHQHDEFPILPRDICVMTPNISEYAPFIRSVFESQESQLSIQLMDMSAPSQYLSIQGFLHLLSLANGRWEASALLQLFEYPAFLARHRFAYEDVVTIRQWIEDSGIYWGADQHHRSEVFKQEYQNHEEIDESCVGTWEYGLGRLLEGLAISVSGQFTMEETYHPIDLDMSHAALLGNLLSLIRSLQADLKPLRNGQLLSLKEWTTYLHCLLETYFLPMEDDTGYELLREHIETFEKATVRLQESKYSFETIHFHFKRLLEQSTGAYKETNLQAIRFSSLLPMRVVPAKVVVLMGIGDGLFPRKERVNTLHLLAEGHADYFPSQVDFDRYLFLEALLSSRQYFLLSYTCQGPGETQEMSPSLLVQEILNYLDQAYCIRNDKTLTKPSTSCLYRHPLLPFHHSYFSGQHDLRSYSSHYYKASMAHYHPEKQTSPPFLSDFSPREKTPTISDSLAVPISIDLKELTAFANNPLKLYLNKTLGVYIEQDEDRTIQDEEDLFLSDLNAALVSRQGVFGIKEAVLRQAEKSGRIPQGSFKEVGIQKISRDIDGFSANLKSCGIEVKQLFSIEMVPHVTTPSFVDGAWKVPPLVLTIPTLGKVAIVGTIEHLSAQGKVLFAQEDIKRTLKAWPECLVLKHLAERDQIQVLPQVIFTKGKKAKIKSLKIEKEDLLTYLEYYFQYKSHPSPLLSDWMAALVSGKEEFAQVLKEKAQDTFQQQFDPYITWLQRNSQGLGLQDPHLAYWQAKIQQLYCGLFKSKPAAMDDHS